MTYNKEEATKFLVDNYGYQRYAQKHFESGLLVSMNHTGYLKIWIRYKKSTVLEFNPNRPNVQRKSA